MTITGRFHRWVKIRDVMDYLALGWIALPTLKGTYHGMWAVHCVWLCDCEPDYPTPNHRRTEDEGTKTDNDEFHRTMQIP